MRVFALVAAVAVLLANPAADRHAGAQPTDAVAPGAPIPLTPGAAGSSDLRLTWEVTNRFRLFRRDADFKRHVMAGSGNGVLWAEHKLARDSDGRGWAAALLGHLCVDASGKLLDVCERDGERENYLAPQDHRIVVRLAGTVPPDATCAWTIDDGVPPVRQAVTPCAEEVRLRVRYGSPTTITVGVTRTAAADAAPAVETVSAQVQVRDLLIAGLGDSVASGEGNPDRPIALADEGFCFRRFLAGVRSEYFRPSREGYGGDKACDDAVGATAATSGATDLDEWARHGAGWLSPACHRSLYSYQMRVALALAVENPHIAVTFIPLACTGATIEAGLFGPQRTSDCPPTGRCSGTMAGQLPQLERLLAQARQRDPKRTLDLMLLTVGANDIRFSGLVADVIVSAGVERTLFRQGGLIATVPEAKRLLDHDLPAGFARLRAALKPLVGGNLSRVLFVPYANPAMQNGTPCPGGRDGLDVHPAFNADDAHLREVAEFTSSLFLPRLKALVLCEGTTICANPATDRMSFVDSHQSAFAQHSICARAADDPPFDRECFSPKGESFDPNPVTAATSPLLCSQRPSDFRPYAPRARWIRTANDSYFTAMTFARALPSILQPDKLHDATWGATSAVYGGAVHPTAEGQAAMADAALPAARTLLGLTAPPEITAEPLPQLAR